MSYASTDDNHGSLFHGEYRPSSAEFLATGIFGIILYLSILAAATYLMVSQIRLLNRLFYASMMVMATFELPRYFFLALDQSYHSLVGYAMHAFSGIFYFICLAIIGLTFANILELGSLSMMIYSKRGLTLAVLAHTTVDISSVIVCLRSSSLSAFFGSAFYRFYIIFDIVQNLTYSLTLFFFGLRLALR